MGMVTEAKHILRKLGVDVARYTPRARGVIRGDLHNLGVKTVFDVGANAGQYAMDLRRRGYAGKIVSFEPLTAAHAELTAAAARDDDWMVHERCALGAVEGESKINVSENSYSSSILPMTRAHEEAAPGSVYIGQEDVKVIPLHSIFHQYKTEAGANFLKIDVQGFEHEVLVGAEPVFNEILGFQLELSSVELYRDDKGYRHYFEYFESRGYRLWDLHRGFSDPKTFQMLQFDAVFVKSDT